jgi:superfamily I DNA/RNA helicase
MVKLANGELAISHTRQMLELFREVQSELERLDGHRNVNEFVLAWLGDQIDDNDPFHHLVADLATTAASLTELLELVVQSVAQPEVPPDVTDVRIMSLHKSKGLSAPVVIIAGCVEGLLPSQPDDSLSAEEQAAQLEEQRRLFFVGLTRVKADPDINRPGVLLLTSSRSMPLADAMQSGIRPARVRYGTALNSRFIGELGPTAPAVQRA